MTERITFSCPDELAERLNKQLEYGDNRSELIRELIEEALDDREHESDAVGSEGCEVRSMTPVPDSLPSTVAADDAQRAIDATLTYLQSESSATRREIVDDVMPDEPLGYSVPEEPSNYRGSWWRKIVRPALAEHDSVEPPQPGGSEYRWVA